MMRRLLVGVLIAAALAGFAQVEAARAPAPVIVQVVEYGCAPACIGMSIPVPQPVQPGDLLVATVHSANPAGLRVNDSASPTCTDCDLWRLGYAKLNSGPYDFEVWYSTEALSGRVIVSAWQTYPSAMTLNIVELARG